MKKISRTLTLLFLMITLMVVSSCSFFHPSPLAIQNGQLVAKDPDDNDNLWSLLGHDLRMDHYPDNADVQAHIQWYMQHQAYIDRMSKRASRYVYFVLQEVKLREMPSELALLPMIESNYDPFAYSSVGAAGLWQMMPGTASGFSVRQNWWYDGRRDIYTSTRAALDYLQALHAYFNDDWLLALAAYNCGEGTVRRAIKANQSEGLPTDFWSLRLPEQTRQYVPKLMAIATILAEPKTYSVNWPQTNMVPFFALVSIDGQIDLAKAARLADISTEDLQTLNPGFNQWATDPSGKHELILPANKVALFEANLVKLPKSQRVTWQYYTAKPGDTITKIAHKFKTTPQLIQQINHLKSNVIHSKQTLLIPHETKTFSKSTRYLISPYLAPGRALPGPKMTTYIVRRGDTLEKVAKLYKVGQLSICYWNQLGKDQALRPGKELIIWLPSKKKKIVNFA